MADSPIITPLKVACIGDSITFGFGLPDRENMCYPKRLQAILDERRPGEFAVRNFGHNGAAVLERGMALRYMATQEFAEAKAWAADILIVCLGMNDIPRENYSSHSSEFAPDYRRLLRALQEKGRASRILLANLPPFESEMFDDGDQMLSNHWLIRGEISAIADADGYAFIDLYKILSPHPDYLQADGLHLDSRGAELIAETVAEALLA